jgi:para-aminobenzoate synthetase/4-amino-4-deoxychorismate lyase
VEVDDPDGHDQRPDPALGVFDTLLVRQGRAVDLTAHLERLTRSVLELYDVNLEVPVLADRIASQTRGLVNARVRTSYRPAGAECAIDVLAVDEPGLQPRTLVVRRVTDGLGRHKWIDRRAVSDPGDADDVLLVDASGLVLECGWSTLFAVLDGTVVTPPLDGRILPGTVRAQVLHLLGEEGTPTTEQPLTEVELGTATEVFGSSSVRGVQPVVACAGVGTWAVGPVTLRLRDRLRDALHDGRGAV